MPANSVPNTRRWLPLVLGGIGLVLHLVVAYFYLAAGLVAPVYGVMFLWTIWAILFAVVLWLLRRHPSWTPVVPVAAVLILFGVLSLGEALLGWRA